MQGSDNDTVIMCFGRGCNAEKAEKAGHADGYGYGYSA